MTTTRPQLVAANDNSAWMPGMPVPHGYYRSSMYPDRIFKKQSEPVVVGIRDGSTDLAARRAWLATLPDDYKPVLAWPTAERLARLESPAAAQALYRYAELMQPHAHTPANDNHPGEDGTGQDMRREQRPSVNELMRAAGPALRVVYSKTALSWSVVKRTYPPIEPVQSGLRLGSLLFRDGQLVSYGETKRGKDLRSIDRLRMPKGSSGRSRNLSAIRFLLPANDNTPIAKGAVFLAGVKGKKGTSTKPDIGDHAASIELDRNTRSASIRLALGLDAAVLDAAITDATAQQIGEAFGYSGKTAERRGIEKINAAIKKLQEIVA